MSSRPTIKSSKSHQGSKMLSRLPFPIVKVRVGGKHLMMLKVANLLKQESCQAQLRSFRRLTKSAWYSLIAEALKLLKLDRKTFRSQDLVHSLVVLKHRHWQRPTVALQLCLVRTLASNHSLRALSVVNQGNLQSMSYSKQMCSA